MKHKDLPERWKLKIAEWLQLKGEPTRSQLSSTDFTSSRKLHLILEHGSTASFNYALAIDAPEWNEIGLFTEHCGYHIFPFAGTQITYIEM